VGSNLSRIENLGVASQRFGLYTLAPGDKLDFNAQIGPYNRKSGYLPANVIVKGEVAQGYGGGTCQVSSTLYNVVLQLTGLTVLRRAPHGPSGISYLPHGVDASSGGLNFVFRNDYTFPVRIYAHVQDGSLFIAFYKEA
jgi:vancomycin resistance protein YoaR